MAEVALRDYLSEIDGLIERGSNDAAIQHCRHILTQYPKCVEAYRVLGKALLEKEEDRAAQDVFERVLSVDPEDFVARVGLSIIHDRNDELAPAIWHMERAFDIAPSNELIQGELRRLYARRDGAAPERIALTRSALARMYTKGDLYEEAIADLRMLLGEQPDRIDLQIQMAEALWRNEQRLDAIDWAQRAMRQLPNCVKANLISGAVLRENGGIAESEAVFKRVQAIDPENIYAEELFGPTAVLPRQPVTVSRLELRLAEEELLMAAEPVAETEEMPEWLRGITGLEALEAVEEEAGVAYEPLPSGVHLPAAEPVSEIPDWLQGLSESTAPAAEANVPDWLAALAGGAAAAALVTHEQEPSSETEAAAELAAAEEMPDWLNRLAVATGPLRADEAAAPPAEEETPDWLDRMAITTGPFHTVEAAAPPAEEETPDWLDRMAITTGPFHTVEAAAPPAEEETPDWLDRMAITTGPFDTVGAAAPPAEEETPDWLDRMAITTGPFDTVEAATPPAEEETPDWLAQISETPPARFPAKPVDTLGVEPQEEMPDWLAQLQSATPALDKTVETGGTPDWLITLASTEEEPTGEPSVETEALAAGLAAAGITWWTQTAEEQEPAQAVEAETVLPAASIEPEEMTAEAAAAAWAALEEEEAEPVTLPPVAEVESREAPFEAAAPEFAAPSAEGAAEAEVPEAMPGADDALAFLARLAAGKEDQLRAQAQEEAEARMAEIMGRKPSAPKPAAPPEAEEKATPVKMTVPAATVAALVAGLAGEKKEEEVKPVEPPPAAETQAEAVPEAMPSADDALAFLARLAAGKEDQLRAQAQEEAEARMAEIIGRKPSAPKPPEARPGVGAAVVAGAAAVGAAAAHGEAKKKEEEVKPVEPPPAAEMQAEAVPEAMPSADDALAFLARLAAGKEDQLRAQAQEEAEARMAEIMGRKPSEPKPPEARPGVGAAVVAGAAAVGAAAAHVEAKKKEETKPVEPPPAAETQAEAVPEAMPSADDALAFLARLAAGKEDQLRAQAQEEAEARMAEIMGRKPSAPKPAEPVPAEMPISTGPAAISQLEELGETPAIEAESLAWLESAEEAAVVTTPEGELPDWLQAMRPTAESGGPGLSDLFLEEALAEEGAELTPAGELPDWLKTMQPSEAQPIAGEISGDLAALFGEEEVPAELAVAPTLAITPESGAVEFGAPAAEPVAERPVGDWWVQLAADEDEELYQLPTAKGTGALSLDWWVQSALDTGEEPLGELPPIPAPPVAASGRAETAPRKQIQLPKTGPMKPATSPLPKRQTTPFGAVSSTGPLPSESSVDSLLARLQANSNDYGARLDLARTYWATGRREDAFEAYSQLASSSVFAKEIMIDLENITDVQDSSDWQRLMGDVYMKAGRLTGALDRYRRALSGL